MGAPGGSGERVVLQELSAKPGSAAGQEHQGAAQRPHGGGQVGPARGGRVGVQWNEGAEEETKERGGRPGVNDAQSCFGTRVLYERSQEGPLFEYEIRRLSNRLVPDSERGSHGKSGPGQLYSVLLARLLPRLAYIHGNCWDCGRLGPDPPRLRGGAPLDPGADTTTLKG